MCKRQRKINKISRQWPTTYVASRRRRHHRRRRRRLLDVVVSHIIYLFCATLSNCISVVLHALTFIFCVLPLFAILFYHWLPPVPLSREDDHPLALVTLLAPVYCCPPAPLSLCNSFFFLAALAPIAPTIIIIIHTYSFSLPNIHMQTYYY